MKRAACPGRGDGGGNGAAGVVRFRQAGDRLGTASDFVGREGRIRYPSDKSFADEFLSNRGGWGGVSCDLSFDPILPMT